jgi:hypothetical protein
MVARMTTYSRTAVTCVAIVLSAVVACASAGLGMTGDESQSRGAKPSPQNVQGATSRVDQAPVTLQEVADQVKQAARDAAMESEKARAFAAIAEIAARRAVEDRSGGEWYQEPSWYALATPIVLATIALYAYKERKRASIADAQRNALLRAVEINEAFIRHQVRGPVAHSLGIPEEQVLQFSKKAVLLLHQMILLRQVFEQRDLLGETAERSHQQWASSVLQPWIESDQDLIKVWTQLRQGRDLFGPEFLKWLEPHIDPPKPALQPTSDAG